MCIIFFLPGLSLSFLISCYIDYLGLYLEKQPNIIKVPLLKKETLFLYYVFFFKYKAVFSYVTF